MTYLVVGAKTRGNDGCTIRGITCSGIFSIYDDGDVYSIINSISGTGCVCNEGTLRVNGVLITNMMIANRNSISNLHCPTLYMLEDMW
ncbi:MAG: hypothetical protein FWG65_03725 [Turicibacter sp.]|nr:hypothetical protein [Turicibacter sp.]